MTSTANAAPEYTDPCPGLKGTDTVSSECGKCSGSGQVNWGNIHWAQNGLDGRWCFDCNGSGKYTRTVRSIRAAARRDHKARLDMFEAEQAFAVEHAAFLAAHPATAARLASIFVEAYGDGSQHMTAAQYEALNAATEKYGQAVLDLANQANYRGLSDEVVAEVEGLIAAATAAADTEAARLAALHHLDAEIGAKVTVTGRVVVSMSVDGFAYNTTDRMVIVEGTADFAGVTFKMTGKAESLFATERGDEVEITAKVKKFAHYGDVPQTILNYAKVRTLAAA